MYSKTYLKTVYKKEHLKLKVTFFLTQIASSSYGDKKVTKIYLNLRHFWICPTVLKPFNGTNVNPFTLSAKGRKKSMKKKIIIFRYFSIRGGGVNLTTVSAEKIKHDLFGFSSKSVTENSLNQTFFHHLTPSLNGFFLKSED